jgi:citrate lyase subunit beta/citryl-CoA lyase
VIAHEPTSRRSCLSVPGSSGKMLAKAARVPADEIVIDLEDAVAPGAKDEARARVAAVLADWGGGAVSVRVNAPRTPWCHQDVAALAALELGAIVVPKVEGAGDLAFVDRLLDGVEAAAGRARPLRVQALIETAAGLARVQEIAAASARLDALILGYADLAASLGGTRDLDAWRPAQEQVLLAARAHGLQAIDGPHLGIAVDDAFAAAVARARDLGFDGKWAIHPVQVDALNAAFTPTDEELRSARAVIAALDAADAGAVALDGQMLDEAVRAAALRTLARAGKAA